MKRRLILRRLHLWATVALGLPFACVTLSGVCLVYWPELSRLYSPELRRSDKPNISWDRIATLARKQPQVVRVNSIFIMGGGNIAEVSVSLQTISPQSHTISKEIAIDLSTDRIVEQPRANRIVGIMFGLHTDLLNGKLGHIVTIATAFGLLFLVGTGIWMWMPRRQRLAKELRYRMTRAAALRDLHVITGVYVSVLAVVSAATGLSLAAPDTFAMAVSSFDDVRPLAPRSGTMMPPVAVHIDPLVAIGSTTVPTAVLTDIFNVDGPGPLELRLVENGQPMRYAGRTIVQIDRASGRILMLYRPQLAGTGMNVLEISRPIHAGAIFGSLGRATVFMLGLIISGSYFTGLALWIRRTRLKARGRRKGAKLRLDVTR